MRRFLQHHVQRLVAPWRPLVFAALLVTPGAAAADSARVPALVPAPQSLTLRGPEAPMNAPWSIAATAGDSTAADLLADELHAAYGWRPAARARRTIALERRQWPAGTDSLTRQQGYELTITPQRITIAAETDCGRYYGIQTLRQLVRGATGGTLPGLVIRDAPSLALRGVSEDLARGQTPTLATLCQTVRDLAYYKVNHYEIYLEGGYDFVALRDRDRTAPLDAEDLAILSREAAKHHVELVPVVQTLGHQEWLLARPRFERMAEIPPPPPGFRRVAESMRLPRLLETLDGEPGVDAGEDGPVASTICPIDTSARALVRRLVLEVCAAGAGGFLHCGGDEPFDLGRGRSRAAVERNGIGGVYADFYADLASVVRASGRRMMLYGDVLLEHPKAISRLPRDVVLIDWHYDPLSAFGSVDTLRRAGFDVVACAGLWTWRAFHPDYAHAWPNIAAAARGARRHSGFGAMVASWGDGGAECLNASNWAGYAYLAACAWSAEEPEASAFLDAYARASFGAAAAGIAGVERTLGWVDLEGRPWHGRLFARPLTIHRRTAPWRAAMTATRERMLRARAVLDAIEPGVTHHRERLEAERLVAERYQLLADRELLLDDIARELRASGGSLPDDRRIAVAARLRQCADRTRDLAERYGEAWFDRNRTAGAEFLVERMNRQGAVLDEMERQLRDGTLAEWQPRAAAGRP